MKAALVIFALALVGCSAGPSCSMKEICKSEVGVGFDWRSGRPVTVVVNACVCPDDFMKEQS